MRTLMPWTRMPTKGESDRVLNRMLEGSLEEYSAVAEWAPSMDVSKTKDSLVAKVEVPGVDPKDIQISLQENLLTIKGEKRQEQKEKEEHYHRVERTYGLFVRTPTFKNGLLTLTLPKTPASKGATIPIKAE